MTIEWHIETRQIKDLKPYHKNPRKCSSTQAAILNKSITNYGMVEDPCINLDNTIIGGHQRIRILKKQGTREIDVKVPNRELDDKEIEELNIYLNRGGEFDYDILANQYEMPDLIDYGFSSNELGLALDNIDVDIEEKPKKEKKKKQCPNCGEPL